MTTKNEVKEMEIEKVVTLPTENFHISPADIPNPKPQKIDEKNIIYHVSK